MKRRSRFGIGAGFLAALAGLMGSAQASQAYLNTPMSAQTVNKEMKATPATRTAKQSRIVHSAGGLDLVRTGEYGMSPKEYGMRFGHGNGKRHTNKLRCSHNAKLKRR